jgi:hypothetical protein
MTLKHGRLLIEGSNSMEEDDWDFLTEDLSQLMQQKNPVGYWKATVTGFGWRKLEGHTDVFQAMNGLQLLQHILPNTDCSFRIYNHGKNGFAINNTHHDSPMWGVEWYIVEKATVRDWNVQQGYGDEE